MFFFFFGGGRESLPYYQLQKPCGFDGFFFFIDPMGLVAGLVSAAVAAVAYGVQYVPVKKYKHLGFETN